MTLRVASRIEEARTGRGEDRVAVVEAIGRRDIVVADGAGGVTGGAAAADAICHACHAVPGDARGSSEWLAWLAQQDARLCARGTGLAAAVVLSIDDNGTIFGASAGDCEIWVFAKGEALNLTARQVRKPLIGDGGAIPVGFSARVTVGTVVVASDGLWKYMSPARIAEAAALRPLEAALDALMAGVRLRSGALQDDVAVVVVEVSPS